MRKQAEQAPVLAFIRTQKGLSAVRGAGPDKWPLGATLSHSPVASRNPARSSLRKCDSTSTRYASALIDVSFRCWMAEAPAGFPIDVHWVAPVREKVTSLT